MIKILQILFFTGMLILPGVSAAENPVEAIVDRTSVALGESLQLQVTVSGSSGDVDISNIRDFKVISRGSGTSINMNNGQFSRKATYTYTLIPLQAGRSQIPRLPVRVDGNIHTTQPIAITVASHDQQPETENQDIFVTGKLSKTGLFESEQAVYTFRLYQTVQVRNVRFSRPDFEGFTASQIGEQKSFSTTLKGRQCHVTQLDYLLIPLTAGEKRIKAAQLSCDVQAKNRRSRRDPLNIFDDPFFGGGRYTTRSFSTEPISVTVKPLPDYTGEGEFSGLVGDFDISASVETTELAVGNSITLSVVIAGSGNIIDAGKPDIDLPPDFKVYEDSPQEDIALDTNGYSGSKTFRIALVPVKDGSVTIAPIALVCFDTKSGSYISRQSSPITLTVSPSENAQPLDVYGGTDEPAKPLRKAVQFTGRDILPIKTSATVLAHRPGMSIVFFAALLCGPLLVFLICWMAARMSQKVETASSQMTRRAEQSLRDAARAKSDADAFMQAIYRAVISAILAKNGSTGESITHAEAAAILRAAGCSEEQVSQVKALLEKIESVMFGGGSADQTFRDDMLKETRTIVKAIKVKTIKP